MVTVRSLIAVSLIFLSLLLVGTYSYKSGLQAGRYDSAHDAWNAGYIDGWENHEKFGTCHATK